MINYIEFFDNLNMFGIKLGLEKVRLLFKLLDNPHEHLNFIHIAGTNGKGSTAALVSAKLSMQGLKTGLYSSPHLISIRERFRIDGKAVDKDSLLNLCEKITPALDAVKEKTGYPPTFFEVTTALAALYFKLNKVRFAVWETGMGGRLDATNIVSPVISVITSIGLDHTSYLGNTEEEIAYEKAGIIKSKVPVICGDLPESAEKIIRNKAEQMNSRIYFPLKKYSGNNLSFADKNKIIADKIIQVLAEGNLVPEKQPETRKIVLNWPARFQILPGKIIIDGAHNPQGTSALVQMLDAEFPENKFKIIFASFCEKEIPESLKILSRKASEFIFTEAGIGKKTASPQKIAELFSQLNSKIPCSVAEDPDAALKKAGSRNILITGSLYLAGDILKILGLKNKTLNIY
jgi:dihydrofolate synthase/folylpolyglutamate synthase